MYAIPESEHPFKLAELSIPLHNCCIYDDMIPTPENTNPPPEMDGFGMDSDEGQSAYFSSSKSSMSDIVRHTRKGRRLVIDRGDESDESDESEESEESDESDESDDFKSEASTTIPPSVVDGDEGEGDEAKSDEGELDEGDEGKSDKGEIDEAKSDDKLDEREDDKDEGGNDEDESNVIPPTPREELDEGLQYLRWKKSWNVSDDSTARRVVLSETTILPGLDALKEVKKEPPTRKRTILPVLNVPKKAKKEPPTRKITILPGLDAHKEIKKEIPTRKKQTQGRAGVCPKSGKQQSYIVRHLRTQHQWTDLEIKQHRRPQFTSTVSNPIRNCPFQGCKAALATFKSHFDTKHGITRHSDPVK